MAGGEGYVSLEELEEYNRVVYQTFMSEKDSYKFYNSYALSKGFSVRKESVRRESDNNEVIWRRYCCSCAGFRSAKHFGRPVKKREPRGLTRCGCRAKLEVQLCEKSGTWFVKNFVDGHNHSLSKPEHAYLLRSQRGLEDPQ
ncbi:hypothetical protein ACP70R_045284 [Stipagrostis hirtigluma subsp. patula]